MAPWHLRHSASKLIGREKELAMLDAAWDSKSTHVVVVRGKGGEGKTSLVATWMAEMAMKDWRGAETVFDWSFYNMFLAWTIVILWHMWLVVLSLLQRVWVWSSR